MVDQKTGCYICLGCGIGERLNPDYLRAAAEGDALVQQVTTHDFLCSAEAVQRIKDDIAREGLSSVCVAACSHRSMTGAFSFPGVPLSRANLREGVIWARPGGGSFDETTQELAADYVRMGIQEAQAARLSRSSEEQGRNDHVLIVGGGVTGMTAAAQAARAGYRVSLVEKGAGLGGALAKMKARVPDRTSYADPVDTGLTELAAEIGNSDKISLYLDSWIVRTSGAPGRFKVQIHDSKESVITLNVGAIIQATGYLPFDANVLTEFDYSANPDVITQAELEDLAMVAGHGPIKRPSDGKTVASVMFVQCAGQRSRKEGHLSYCSGHCCSTSIKQAMYFKDENPAIETVVLFTELRTPGSGGETFYRSGQKKGINFVRGEASHISAGNSGPAVTFSDQILKESQTVEFDLVVLATGMVPNFPPNPDKDWQRPAQGNDSELNHLESPKAAQSESILNLDYSQGPDLPVSPDGFALSATGAFPYETRRTGIYAAGTVRRPMGVQEAMEDATAAALKAIRSLENAAQGRSSEPRAGDLSFPRLRAEGCTQCGVCSTECPFSAIDTDAQGQPTINESRCRRCGICMGGCPVRVISFDDYSVDSVSQQIKSLEIPDAFDEKPRILVFACENDAYPALDLAARAGNHWTEWARIIPVRCLGSVNSAWVSDALNAGFDGVVLMGCRQNDDSPCHFTSQDGLGVQRMAKISEILEQLKLESERVAMHEVAITDIKRAPQLINEMADTVARIGLNPFKH